METKKNDCCNPQFFTEDTCSICKQKAKDVSEITLSHMIKKEYQLKMESLNGFYFCKTSNCEVVYFKGTETIKQDNLNKEIGLKDWANPSTVCYCFNWTKEKMNEEILVGGKTTAIKDISSKMSTDKCECEINNPSGKCCLKDVKQTIKELI
jgi:recombinational DNA repair protein RecR